MSDESKFSVLLALSNDAVLGQPTRLSFNALGKTLQLSKAELDAILTELNKGRYITQYSKKGVDSFSVQLLQKGLDTAEDGSFF